MKPEKCNPGAPVCSNLFSSEAWRPLFSTGPCFALWSLRAIFSTEPHHTQLSLRITPQHYTEASLNTANCGIVNINVNITQASIVQLQSFEAFQGEQLMEMTRIVVLDLKTPYWLRAWKVFKVTVGPKLPQSSLDLAAALSFWQRGKDPEIISTAC